MYSGQAEQTESVFSVDFTVGRNLVLRLDTNDRNHVTQEPRLIRPNGTIVGGAEFDPNTFTWTVSVPMAEVGQQLLAPVLYCCKIYTVLDIGKFVGDFKHVDERNIHVDALWLSWSFSVTHACKLVMWKRVLFQKWYTNYLLGVVVVCVISSLVIDCT